MTLAELEAIDRQHGMRNYARFPVEFVRGAGTRLYDDAGNEYLDFVAGLAVSSVGHCHPSVVAAIGDQARRLIHVTNLYYTEPAVRLAKRLSDSSLGGSVLFTNSGAEAVEAAIKIARKAHQRGRVISVHGAFHGRTYGALSATPQESKQAPFAPLVGGFEAVPPTPAAIAAAVADDTAAVLLEPVQGETGVHVLPDELLVAAREACDRHDAALIFDEVQCGLGRTGSLWAYQSSSVVPDILLSAKALAGGLPMGAVITGSRYGDVLEPGDHGSTFAGGPVVAAAALAAFDVIDDAELLAGVVDRGRALMSGLAELPYVRSVRGRGLMVACEVDVAAPDVVRRALLEERLLVNATDPATIRMLPPLTVEEADVDEALRRLGRALDS